MIARIFRIISGLISILFLLMIPVNKYQWMYEEGMTELPEDSDAAMYKFLSILPLLLFILLSLFVKNKKERIIFLCISASLLVFWIAKFFF